jgi:dTDP-4-dehydrorhamnose reductase
MRTVVLGAAGQLGRALVAALAGRDPAPVALTRDDLDIADAAAVRRTLHDLRPTCVINTAAYNRVDACEDGDELHAAFAVNAFAVRHLARACREIAATLVHFSTDFVFDGEKGRPYDERDPPRPQSVYATSKLAGEHFARAYCERHLVIRTCGLYGARGPGHHGWNFVEKMLELAASGRPIRVVADQVVAPTFVDDLARAVVALLEREGGGPPDYYGVYHVTNTGECSWYDFAAAVFAEAGVRANLAPISSAEYAAPARRPSYSVLAHTRLRRQGVPPLRPWRDALRSYLAEREGPRND